MRIWNRCCAAGMAGLLLLLFGVSCTTQGGTPAVDGHANLMDNVKPKTISTAEPSSAYLDHMADFSLELFREVQAEKQGKNILLSPLSLYFALAMTANGSEGTTQQEFEQLLGGTLDEVNPCASKLLSLLHQKDGALQLADSIWFDQNRINADKEFLQTNADYYGADAFQEDFSDSGAVGRINQWVADRTGGKIKDLVQELAGDQVMLLFNTAYFEAKWQSPYYEHQMKDGVFHGAEGDATATFMMDQEQWLSAGTGDAIRKPYADHAEGGPSYAFLAVLPEEGIAPEEYLSTLTGAEFRRLASGETEGLADTTFPKFSFEDNSILNQPLVNLGLNTAFDGDTADFERLGSSKSGRGLYISEVRQKSFIRVDDQGTEAGAATMVAVNETGMVLDPKIVVFDRPFLAAVVEETTGLPVFLCIVNNTEK